MDFGETVIDTGLGFMRGVVAARPAFARARFQGQARRRFQRAPAAVYNGLANMERSADGMNDEAQESGTLDVAIHRLDRALGQLELRLSAVIEQVQTANHGLFDQDRAKLAAELDAARGRERELEIAGSLASQALGRAIADIRAVLGEEG
jgi:hypothetical protein